MEPTVMWNRSPSVTSWNDCLVYLAQRMGTQKQLLPPDHFLFLPQHWFPPRCHLTKPLSVNNLRCWQTAEADHTLQSSDIIFSDSENNLESWTDLRLSSSFGHADVAIVVQSPSFLSWPSWPYCHQNEAWNPSKTRIKVGNFLETVTTSFLRLQVEAMGGHWAVNVILVTELQTRDALRVFECQYF